MKECQMLRTSIWCNRFDIPQENAKQVDFTPRPLVAGSTSAFSLRLQPHPAEEFVSKPIKKELVLPAGSKKQG